MRWKAILLLLLLLSLIFIIFICITIVIIIIIVIIILVVNIIITTIISQDISKTGRVEMTCRQEQDDAHWLCLHKSFAGFKLLCVSHCCQLDAAATECTDRRKHGETSLYLSTPVMNPASAMAACRGHIKLGRAGQGRAGQGKAGQGRAEQGSLP